jgi:hypothetical protein
MYSICTQPDLEVKLIHEVVQVVELLAKIMHLLVAAVEDAAHGTDDVAEVERPKQHAQARHQVVAVQVEKQHLKPGYHISGSRVETRRLKPGCHILGLKG